MTSLLHMMTALGFAKQFVGWIEKCIAVFHITFSLMEKPFLLSLQKRASGQVILYQFIF